jgi:hypothetical protein
MKDFGQGMFTMPFITEISAMKSLQDAKQRVANWIDDSTATPDNKAKARQLVLTSTSINRLVIGMSNFNLAHQGLKVR